MRKCVLQMAEGVHVASMITSTVDKTVANIANSISMLDDDAANIALMPHTITEGILAKCPTPQPPARPLRSDPLC